MHDPDPEQDGDEKTGPARRERPQRQASLTDMLAEREARDAMRALSLQGFGSHSLIDPIRDASAALNQFKQSGALGAAEAILADQSAATGAMKALTEPTHMARTLDMKAAFESTPAANAMAKEYERFRILEDTGISSAAAQLKEASNAASLTTEVDRHRAFELAAKRAGLDAGLSDSTRNLVDPPGIRAVREDLQRMGDQMGHLGGLADAQERLGILGLRVEEALDGAHLPSFEPQVPEVDVSSSEGRDLERWVDLEPPGDQDRRAGLELTKELVSIIAAGREEDRQHRKENKKEAEARRREDREEAESWRREDRAEAETRRREDREEAEARRREEAPAIAANQAQGRLAARASVIAVAVGLVGVLGTATAVGLGYLDWLGDEQLLGVTEQIRDRLPVPADSASVPDSDVPAPLSLDEGGYVLPSIDEQIQALCKAPVRC